MGILFGTVLTLLAIFLILLVLVQRGRGGGLTGALGGMGGSSAFGAKAGDVFTRITIVIAGIWIADLCAGRSSGPTTAAIASDAGGATLSTATQATSPKARLRPRRRVKPPANRRPTRPPTSPAAEAPSDAAPSPRDPPSRNSPHQELATLLASMTGFGEARGQAAGLSVHVEVRTINNRHFKLGYRSSDGYASLEPDVEAIVRQAMRRGTVQVNLRVDRQLRPRTTASTPRSSRVIAGRSTTLDGRNGWSDSVGLDVLLQLPGVGG